MLGEPPALWAALVVQFEYFKYFACLGAEARVVVVSLLPAMSRSSFGRFVSRVNSLTDRSYCVRSKSQNTPLNSMARRCRSLAMCVGRALRSSSKGFCQVLCSAVAWRRLLQGAELMSTQATDSGRFG